MLKQLQEDAMRNRIFSTAVIVAVIAVASVICLAAQQASAPPPSMSDNVSGYHLSASIPLPDEGFWDYLGIDEPNHHLFVSHSDEILVISTTTK
jgi:hypothetical protein